MAENGLVDRLRKAKAELTALKTAHRRGSGLMKIFCYDVKNPGYVMEFDFSKDFPPYPFLKITVAYETAIFGFTNNGYSVRVINQCLQIVSTTPIIKETIIEQ